MRERFAEVGACSATMERHSPERFPQPVAQLAKTATCRQGYFDRTHDRSEVLRLIAGLAPVSVVRLQGLAPACAVRVSWLKMGHSQRRTRRVYASYSAPNRRCR